MLCTDLLTLTDRDQSWLTGACQAFRIRQHYLPVSPIANAGKPLSIEDLQTVNLVIATLKTLLESDRYTVVHCVRGLHRAGILICIVLKTCGLSTQNAVAHICAARARTGHELSQATSEKRRNTLIPKVHAIISKLLTGWGNDSAWTRATP